MEATRRGFLGLFGALPFMKKSIPETFQRNLVGEAFSISLSESNDSLESSLEDLARVSTSGDNSYYVQELRSIRSLFGLGKGKRIERWKLQSLRRQARNCARSGTDELPNIDSLRSVSAVHKQAMRERFYVEDLALTEIIGAEIDVERELWRSKMFPSDTGKPVIGAGKLRPTSRLKNKRPQR